MLYFMIFGAIIVLLCISSSKLLYKFGVPTLLIFMVLGMLFGSDGFGKIAFDDYSMAKDICSFGLVFIMFYGGFGTSWKAAKPVAFPAVVMSTGGVVITAALTGVFCHFVLKTSWLEGFLIGSVLSSTDAASVFAILRSKKLNLRGGLASLLEVESGSNDPFSYMLTLTVLTLMSGEGESSLLLTVVLQIVLGLGIGFVLMVGSAYVLKRVNLEIDGLYSIFVAAVAILAYAVSEQVGGNGYLCVYIVGLGLGNSKILHKHSLVHFFDGISWLMQIMLFFTLGLLSFPSSMPDVFLPGVLISLFLLFVARPAASFFILKIFKFSGKSIAFVSWVGLRGAASIVFAIYALNYNVALKNDIFHIVFFVALFSVAVQGTLIPFFAKRLDLVAEEDSVLKTFTDYQEEMGTKLMEFPIDSKNHWVNKSIMDAEIPEEILVVMIKRHGDVIVPKGSTVIRANDVLVLSANDFEGLQMEG